MLDANVLVSSLLGPSGRSARLLAAAVEVAIELLFVQKIPISDVRVSKQIYPVVGKRFRLSAASAGRAVERAANRCWDKGDPELLEKIIGRKLTDIGAPRDMIFYLACYAHLEQPFYSAILSCSRSAGALFF